MLNDFTENSVDEYHVGRDLFAFRAFRIGGEPQTLTGLTFRQELAPEVNVAQCPFVDEDDEESEHFAPAMGCSCGWYAYDERRHWQKGTTTSRHGKPIPGWATGVVRLSGRIIVCERGLKAEYMEVVALAVHPMDEFFVRSEFPDVKVFSDERKMLKQYPLERLPREKEDEMGGSAGDLTVARPLRKALNAGTNLASNVWRKITAQPRLGDVLRALVKRSIMGAVFLAVVFAGLGALRTYFPPESLSGFGSLVPFGLLVLLSPLLNMWRSVGGPCLYLILLTYGLMGSRTAVDVLLGEGSPWAEQMGVAVIILYVVPVVALGGRIARRMSSQTPTAGAMATRPYGSQTVILGQAGVGKTYNPLASARSANRLPKKVKSSPPRGGDTTPGTVEGGGQHG